MKKTIKVDFIELKRRRRGTSIHIWEGKKHYFVRKAPKALIEKAKKTKEGDTILVEYIEEEYMGKLLKKLKDINIVEVNETNKEEVAKENETNKEEVAKENKENNEENNTNKEKEITTLVEEWRYEDGTVKIHKKYDGKVWTKGNHKRLYLDSYSRGAYVDLVRNTFHPDRKKKYPIGEWMREWDGKIEYRYILC